MPEQDNDPQEPRSPLISRRALLGGLAAASVTPLLLQGLPAEATAAPVFPAANPLPRQMHAAVLIGNNQVMFIGGQSAAGEPMDDVVVYGSGGTISQLASLNVPRYAHAAVLLSYSQVLVLGGYGQGPLDSAEIYNPITNTWTATTSLLLPRYNHTAIRSTASQVLVVGGVSQGILSDTELYNL